MIQKIKDSIRSIPDYPKAGIVFKDITPLLQDGALFRETVDHLAEPFKNDGIEVVVGIESRGFIFGAALAYSVGASFVPVRKKGKLPHMTLSESYELEYGTDALEIHEDAVQPNQKVLIVDDLLATGGTVSATSNLIRRLQGNIVGFAFLIELTFLNGRKRLGDGKINSLISYGSEH
jgi:adenine phosphoribosyltransferase